LPVFHKFPVEPSDKVQYLELPGRSEIVSAIDQDGQVMIYALVHHPEWSKENVPFLCVGTGWNLNLPSDLEIDKVVGAVRIGRYVWHVLSLQEIDKLPF